MDWVNAHEVNTCGVQGLILVAFRDGAVVRALASHQRGPSSIPRSGVIYVDEFVGSLLCTEMFSPETPPLKKKSAFDLICVNY